MLHPNTKLSLLEGAKTGTPLVFSASFFGMIFGFTGGSGDLPLYFISSMSFIIFAGSAQFIALILIIEGEPLLGIIVAGIIINLRHLLYSAVLSEKLQETKLKKVVISYFITDEAFLVTTLVDKKAKDQNDERIIPDYVLLGVGLSLWISWNFFTIIGYFIFQISDDLIELPGNFIIAASFVGFLIEQWKNFPAERSLILFTTSISLVLGFYLNLTPLLIVIMLLGAVFGMLKYSKFGGN